MVLPIKKLLLTFALVFVAALTGRADVIIEQKVESATLNGNLVMKIRGDQSRMDVPSLGGPVTVFFNFKTREITTLMAAQKIFLKMAMKPEQAGRPEPTTKATGVTERVGAYTAEVYDFTAGKTSGKVWVARDFPDADAVKAELKKVSEATPMGANPWVLDVPGMVVRSQIAASGVVVTTTVTSARIEKVPDSEFVIPAGYHEIKASSLSAGVGTPQPAAAEPGAKPAEPAAGKKKRD